MAKKVRAITVTLGLTDMVTFTEGDYNPNGDHAVMVNADQAGDALAFIAKGGSVRNVLAHLEAARRAPGDELVAAITLGFKNLGYELHAVRECIAQNAQIASGFDPLTGQYRK